MGAEGTGHRGQSNLDAVSDRNNILCHTSRRLGYRKLIARRKRMENWISCADGSVPSLIPSLCPVCSVGASAHDEILILGTATRERKRNILVFFGHKVY